MAEFIELTEYDGEKVLLNKEHILKVCPDDEGGAYVYFDVVMLNGNSSCLRTMHVAESYSAIKKML